MDYQKVSSATAFSRELTNGHSHKHSRSFSGKSIYDGVFAAPAKKIVDAVEDYGEIFGGSGSSIPVLDVPELNERKVSVDVWSSKLDYSEVFGGFDEFDFALSHEELLAKSKKSDTSPFEEAWDPAETGFPSKVPVESPVSSHEACYHSVDSTKQFKMSYHRTNQGSKKGTNGTTHIAQLHAIPGFTCLIDDISPVHMSKGNVPVSSVKDNACSRGVIEGKHCKKAKTNIPTGGANKQSTRSGIKFQNKSNQNGCNLNDMQFDAYETDFKTYHSKMKPSSSLPRNLGNNRGGYERSMASKFGVSKSYSSGDAAGLCSPPFFDEEADANSVAAVSAAAVKQAIEEAQERIKFAKELMERKKESLQNRVKPRFNDELKAEERREGKIMSKANKFSEKEIRDMCEEVGTLRQVFSGIGEQSAMKANKLPADLRGGGKLNIAREAPRETLEKNFKSTQVDNRQEEAETYQTAKQGDNTEKMMQSGNDYEWEEKNVAAKTFANPEGYTKKIKAVEGALTQGEVERKHDAVKRVCDSKECPDKLKSADESLDQEENENNLRVDQQYWKETEEKLSVSPELEACERKQEEIQRPTNYEIKLEMQVLLDNEKIRIPKDAQERVENENQKELLEQEENGTRLENVPKGKENEMRLNKTSVQKEFGKSHEEACEMIDSREAIKEAFRLEENEEEPKEICSGEDAEKRSDEVQELETIEVRLKDFHDSEENEERPETNCDLGGNEELIQAKENRAVLKETSQMKEIEKRQKETCEWVEIERIQTQIDQRAEAEKIEATKEIPKYHENNNEVSNDACEDEIDTLRNTMESCMHEEINESKEITPEVLAHEENGGIMGEAETFPECKLIREELKVVEVTNDQEEKEVFEIAGLAQDDFELNDRGKQVKDTTEAHPFDKNEMNLVTSEQKQYDQHAEEFKIFCNMGKHAEEFSCESEENNKDVDEAEITDKQEENENNCRYSPEERWVDNWKNMEAAQPPSMFEGETTGVTRKIETSQSTENIEENQHETLAKEESKAKDTSQREVEPDEEHLNKIDEAKEREREREKERIVVERAIREARERAFAEARERAERATLERANTEARRRVRGEALGRSDKTSGAVNDKSSVDKASMEAKLKAERAAVERATAEARERALEKALSDKTAFQARNQTEKFSGSSRDNGMKGFSSFDSESKTSGPSKSSSFPNSSNHVVPSSTGRSDGVNDESAQSSKARLEKHQRTAERAAKALAEKNMHDLLAQKEQTERNRLAETLDADVKRWSSGKAGNLRALISTLQYILGPDSGWQPTPLTDLIASTAVKKAYRKATLCVHPDKLQQRGASIQQKYICEKVFDLLKEAWNKFSAEER